MIIIFDPEYVANNTALHDDLNNNIDHSKNIDCIHQLLSPHENASDLADEECDSFMKGYN